MKKNSYVIFLIVTCLLFSQVFAVGSVLAVGGAVSNLSYTKLTLAGTTAITSDVTIGQLQSGVSIDSGASTIVSPNSAKFSFTSDDGSEKDYNFRDVYTSKGVSLTIPVITDYISKTVAAGQVSLQHLLELQNNNGFEIGSHTNNHPFLTKLATMDDVTFQLTESKRLMTAMGLKINNFFVPYGAFTEPILDECKKYYRSTRVSLAGVNTPLDKRKMKANWLDSGVTLAVAKKLVDTARVNNQFVIFGYHAGSASRAFMDGTVGALISYIQSFNNTQVLTVDKALDRIENVMNKDVDYRIVNGNIVLDKFFVRSLPIGDNVLTFGFSDGSKETITVTIEKNNGILHNISVTSSSLSVGNNVLADNQTITLEATLDANIAGVRTSTATIGNTSVNGLLNGNVYSYTFNTKDIDAGSYNKITIKSNIDNNQAVIDVPVSLVVDKAVVGKTVSRVEASTLPSKMEYLAGEAFSADGMVVTAFYEDGSTAVVYNYLVSGFTSTTGVNTVTVSFGGVNASFDVTVSANKFTGIVVTTKPTKLTYTVGDSLDLSGMVVTAYYSDYNNNITTGVVADYTVSGYTVTAGTKTISVSYLNKSAIFTVVVNPATTILSPTSVVATSMTYTSVKVTWATVAGVSGYSVYRALSETGPYTLITSKTAVSHTDSGLTTGTTYYYKISAYLTSGATKTYSNLTAAVSVTPAPIAPTNFNVVKSSTTSIKITWYAAPGANGYEIYRATSATGNFTLLLDTKACSYVNAKLTTNTTYYYKVRAYSVVGGKKIYGGFTVVKSAKPY